MAWSEAAQAPPVQGRQAIYDAAQSAFDRSDWSAAAEGFGQLLPPDASKPLSRSMAIIALRRSEALSHLNRLDEGEILVDRALKGLAQDDPVTLAEALTTKAEIERFRYEYVQSLKDYERADALVSPLGFSIGLVNIRAGEAVVGATIDPALMKSRLDDLLARPELAKSVSKTVVAQLEDLEARAAINHGDKRPALRMAARAVDDSGGLTMRVSLAQVSIRADAGVIARLNDENNDTRRYFAYTGAGHLNDASWVRKHSGDLPVCDSEIAPEDSVVVSIAIADDGRVVGAVPTYASHTGSLGVSFARAISTWRWDPDAIKKIEPFWRSSLQLALRCLTRPNPESLSHFVWKDALEWLADRKLVDAATVEKWDYLRVRADDPRLKQPGGAVLEAVAGPLPPDQAAMERMWRAMDKDQGPPAAYALLISRWAGERQQNANDSQRAVRIGVETYQAWTPRFRLQFPNDPALSWLILIEALARQDSGDFEGALPLLAALGAAPSTATEWSSAIKNVALLHEAISLDRMGKAAAAKDSLERSGLNEQVCSMFDTHPIQEERHIGSNTYPDEALRWLFEGFVQEAFDIGDDGHVRNIRTVVAYPPYIFDTATERAMRTFVYIPPRLGGKAVGCESQQQVVNYRLAGGL